MIRAPQGEAVGEARLFPRFAEDVDQIAQAVFKGTGGTVHPQGDERFAERESL